MTALTTDTMSIWDRVRDATQHAHRRLDMAMNSVDLGRLHYYAGFLRGQAEALIPIETALEQNGIEELLPDWPQRARTPALEHDLSVLDIACDPLLLPDFAPRAGERIAEMLGTVYVLEGSRMRSRVILSRLTDQPDPSILGATSYLRHGFGKRFWPTFQETLESHPDARARIDRVVDGALLAFGMFEGALIPVMNEALDRSRSAVRLVHSAPL